MILDASILIALLDDRDAHHEAAADLVVDGHDLRVHDVTLAEALVQPVRLGREGETLSLFESLSIRVAATPEDFAARLARVRSDTTLTMPDCIVLATAELDREAVATFDDRLARTAQQRGIETLPAR